MKGRLLILTLAAVLTAGTAVCAVADVPATGGTPGADISAPTPQQAGAGFRKQREDKHAAMAALLGLSDAQQAQIKSIVTAARQANAPLRQKLAADRKKIRGLANATPFDEAAVRSLLAGDESTRTELALSRIKVKLQIQAVLTPEQQAKAKQLRQLNPDKHRNWDNPGF